MTNGGTLEQAKRAEEMMLGELVHLLPVGVLTLGAVLAIVLAIVLPRRRQGLVGAWVALAHVAAVGLAAFVWLNRGFAVIMSGTITVDGLALTLTGLIGVAGALCVALARPSVAGTDREGEFYATLAFASLAAVLLVMASDAALVALAVGALGLATFVLTGYARGSKRANEASVKYYLFGTVSGAAMIYGMSWWFGLAGTTDLAAVGEALVSAPVAVAAASTALVLFGLGYKAAVVPFHFWTPDAYEGAPVSVAAYLSIVPKVAGIAAIARVLSLALPGDLLGWSTAIAAMAAATMTLGNVAALAQGNVVRLMAYSSIAQTGYLLMGIAALGLSEQGLPAFVFYSAAYAAMNLGAFAVVYAVQHERKSVGLDAFSGLSRTHPWWTVVLMLSLLSLIGIPPLGGFVGKLELFKASIDAGQAWLAVVAVLNTVVSLVFYLRVLAPTVLDPDPGRTAVATWTRGSRRTLNSVLIASGVATVAIGLLAEPLIRLAEAATMLVS